MYDKGVYFANNALYSNRYSHADASGTKRMFLCRVAVGEFCLETDGMPALSVRNAKKHLLYDSTTDNMNPDRRDVCDSCRSALLVSLFQFSFLHAYSSVSALCHNPYNFPNYRSNAVIYFCMNHDPLAFFCWQMYVVYHDAQAYPEYLTEYSV